MSNQQSTVMNTKIVDDLKALYNTIYNLKNVDQSIKTDILNTIKGMQKNVTTLDTIHQTQYEALKERYSNIYKITEDLASGSGRGRSGNRP